VTRGITMKLLVGIVTAAMALALAGCHALPAGPTADGSKQAPGDFSTATGKRETGPGTPQ
jgi:hypothetical protein